MSRKTNTMLIGLLGTILMGLATWTLGNINRTSAFGNYDSTRPVQY